MATKTDRILSYLPSTFRVTPRPDVLYALIDAFGRDLLLAENSLAAVMAAHWVDYADRNAANITDLAKIAALYGLAPRREADLTGLAPSADAGDVLETVEEFREHLKRYIRTFLEGTVTVQGILRVTAEALALQIADDYQDLDCWWQRRSETLTTIVPRLEDAAFAVFGMKAGQVAGRSAHPAQVKGSMDLSNGVDLRGANLLRLKIGDENPIEIDLTTGANAANVSLNTIVATLNQPLIGQAIARAENGLLAITSLTSGASSRIEIHDGLSDAAERVFGLVPWVYRGSESQSAQVIGTVALSDSLDLRQHRYLRLVVDRTRVAEIDCAGANPAQTTPQQVCDAINQALQIANFATLQAGHYLKFTSPITGFNSSIAFQTPAAQDATAFLFGEVQSFYIGQDPQPAKFKSQRDLSQGIDLRDRATLRFQVDSNATITVNCAGNDPRNTQITEIVTAINQAAQAEIATQDGQFITLASRDTGSSARLILDTAPTHDALETILGARPRVFEGRDATAAAIVSVPNLTQELNPQPDKFLQLTAIQIAVDGGSPVEIPLRINLRSPGENVSTAQRRHVHEIANAINHAFPNLAIADQQRLILRSSTFGDASRLEVLPLEIQQTQRFMTRAKITDEAALKIFGFLEQEAQGDSGTNAQIIGAVDLSRSVDLQTQPYLRIRIDNHPPIDINCAGQRPRVTAIDEVVKAINTRLGRSIASHDGQHLILSSPTASQESRIAVTEPQAGDAIAPLGLQPGTFKGQDATKVSFVGLVDLHQGITLPPHAAIKLGIDGADPIEISFTDAEPNFQRLDQLLLKINTTLNQVIAKTDGQHISLTSPSTGTNGKIQFAVPTTGANVTAALLGITPPRLYEGSNAIAAQITGTIRLDTVDLRIARFLRIKIGNAAVKEIDCAAGVPIERLNAVTLNEIINAINTAVPGLATASPEGPHLVLRSPQPNQELVLEPYTSGDARKRLLGEVPTEVTGTNPTPATITGTIDLSRPANLSRRSLLRLAVNGDRSVDIDVGGFDPGSTFSDEIIAAINAVFPGLATLNSDDRLQLIAPNQGSESQLSLLPLRYLDLIEYAPKPMHILPRSVRHGDHWAINNPGVVESSSEITIHAPFGVEGPMLVNTALGWRVRVFTLLDRGESVTLQTDAKLGLQAMVTAANGVTRKVPSDRILVGPLGGQVWVPFAGAAPLNQDTEHQLTLDLNNPQAAEIVHLRARQADQDYGEITVKVVESAPTIVTPANVIANGSEVTLVGRVRMQTNTVQLVDATEDPIAQLKPSAGITLSAYQDRVVTLSGILYADRILLVQQIDSLFDVTVQPTHGKAEPYSRVTIGGATTNDSLVYQICVRSRLVVATALNKGQVLTLPQGKSNWIYLDCYSSRFDQAYFDEGHFAGGVCYERGIFDVSRFENEEEPPQLAAVFAAATIVDPPVEITFAWQTYQPGSFQVNLPADLPTPFGARFNQARFSQEKGKPDLYPEAVLENTGDPTFDQAHSLVNLLERSNLVKAEEVDRIPLGWKPITLPFRKPQRLTLGTASKPAQIYLIEKALADQGVNRFIKVQAREPGTWGNDLKVSARPAGAAMYEVTIAYTASRFENARRVALGNPLSVLTQEILHPQPIGVLQAKAAGVEVDVTRETCQ
ncbi:hypothetical protein C7B65_06090 [Phormidesmis priestleyi ULC007]|uniref:Uncharacterized protein n=1 Tax=Phormidesmis priestleyi ULC007 TaxID=1920490 RepID=A0A2T1DKJ0_9CYAN|nr:hypothetical protein [Phormidesmis priestleyi]PSB20971.1 hypothetical protein C7B65_06090 [Phormidesmis priestleyi ULC007]PZO51926.1 MAG: hypothetical protein DCF14_08235 [Phormidesmis priestleyi]